MGLMLDVSTVDGRSRRHTHRSCGPQKGEGSKSPGAERTVPRICPRIRSSLSRPAGNGEGDSRNQCNEDVHKAAVCYFCPVDESGFEPRAGDGRGKDSPKGECDRQPYRGTSMAICPLVERAQRMFKFAKRTSSQPTGASFLVRNNMATSCQHHTQRPGKRKREGSFHLLSMDNSQANQRFRFSQRGMRDSLSFENKEEALCWQRGPTFEET